MAKVRTVCQAWGLPPRSVSHYDAQAFGNGENIVTGLSVFLTVLAVNKSASPLWVQFFDAAAVPANTAVPKFIPLYLAANAQATLTLNDVVGGGNVTGIPFTTGITWSASTTAGTLTADTSNSIWVAVRYLG